MAGITQEVRTIMYSVEPSGHVAVHRFPFNANDRDGMEKLQRFVSRGFTFADPRIPGSSSIPEVVVTGVVDLAKPVLTELVGEQASETALLSEEPVAIIPPSEVPKVKRKYTKRKKRKKRYLVDKKDEVREE